MSSINDKIKPIKISDKRFAYIIHMINKDRQLLDRAVIMLKHGMEIIENKLPTDISKSFLEEENGGKKLKIIKEYSTDEDFYEYVCFAWLGHFLDVFLDETGQYAKAEKNMKGNGFWRRILK